MASISEAWSQASETTGIEIGGASLAVLVVVEILWWTVGAVAVKHLWSWITSGGSGGSAAG